MSKNEEDTEYTAVMRTLKIAGIPYSGQTDGRGHTTIQCPDWPDMEFDRSGTLVTVVVRDDE